MKIARVLSIVAGAAVMICVAGCQDDRAPSTDPNVRNSSYNNNYSAQQGNGTSEGAAMGVNGVSGSGAGESPSH